jgi:NarL family two-component system sensor histidine kinase LiaS
MKSKKEVLQQEAGSNKPSALKWWSSLQFRITISYALTTMAAALLLEILLLSTFLILITYGSVADSGTIARERQTAQLYALVAGQQANGNTFDPRITFEPGQPYSIALPQITSANNNNPADLPAPYIATNIPSSQNVSIALLIDTQGKIIASSYPARYPGATLASSLLPGKSQLITRALSGIPANTVDATPQGRVASVMEPVWNREKQEIGVIYLQTPEISSVNIFPEVITAWLFSGIFWLLLTLPIGALFGWLTARGLVRRFRQLTAATSRFASGDYTERVPISRRDEVGQLQLHFNQMADQLVESIEQRQTLAAQGARMEERTRLSRDLHDSVKQQVFAVNMQIGTALALLDDQKEATRNHLLEAETLAHQAQQELTTLIRELRPIALQDNKGLAVALQDYVTNWGRQYDIVTEIQIAETCALPPPVEEALLRVTQEALSNIARHSQATSAILTLACEQGQALLSITDNGRGFDTTNKNGAGVGLHSMQERMQALGGRVVIESRVGEGTRLIASSSYTQ